jgi:hypothetical protein
MPLYVDPESGDEYELDEQTAKEFGFPSTDEYLYAQKPLAERAENTAAGFGASLARGVMAPIEVGARLLDPPTAESIAQFRRESYGSPEALEQRERDPILSGLGESALPIVTGLVTGGLAGTGLRAAATGLAAESTVAGLAGEAVAATDEERDYSLANAARLGATDFALGLGAHGLARLAAIGPKKAVGQALGHGASVLAEVTGRAVSSSFAAAAAEEAADEFIGRAMKYGGAGIGFGVGGPVGAVAGYVAGKKAHKHAIMPFVKRAISYAQDAARRHGSDAAGVALLTAAALDAADDEDQGAALGAMGLGLFSKRLFAGTMLGAKRAGQAIAEFAPVAGRAVVGAVAEHGPVVGAAVKSIGGDAARYAGQAISRNAPALKQGVGSFATEVASDATLMKRIGRNVGGTLGAYGGPLGSALGSKAGELAAPKLAKSLLDWFGKRTNRTTAENVAESVTEAVEQVVAKPEVAAVAHEAAKEFTLEASESLQALAKQTPRERAAALQGASSRIGGSAKAQLAAINAVVDDITAGLGKVSATDIYSKSGRPDYAFKGTARQAASYDARIAAYGKDPRFIELLQQHAASTRRTPFGPGKERELWELQKDILDANEELFPRVPYEIPTGAPDAAGVSQAAADFAAKAKEALLGARTAQERFRLGMALTETLTDHAAKAGDGEMAKVFGAYAERLWETMGRSELWLSPKQLQREGQRALKKQAKLLENVAKGEEAAEAMVKGPSREAEAIGNPKRPVDAEAVAIGTGLGPVLERAASKDEWLATFPTRAAREAAEDELEEAVIETFQTFGRVPRRGTRDWQAAESHVIAERLAEAQARGQQRGVGTAEAIGIGALAAGGIVGLNLLARAKRKAEENIAFDDLEGLPPEDRAAVIRANGPRYAAEAKQMVASAIQATGDELARARRGIPRRLVELTPDASDAQRVLVADVYDDLDATERALRAAGADEAADTLADAADSLTDIAVAHEQRLPVDHDAGTLLQTLAELHDQLSAQLDVLPAEARDVVAALRAGTEKRELWGDAADMLADVRRDQSAELGAMPDDPDSVQSYLESSRGLADVYERWGIDGEALRAAVDALDRADAGKREVEIEAARHGIVLGSAGQDPEDTGPVDAVLASAAREAGVSVEEIRQVLPRDVADQLERGQRAYRYDQALRAIERGSQVSVRRAARGAAGLRSRDEPLTPDASTADFAAGYSDEVAAFEARRSMLEAVMSDPVATIDAMASSFGDLPETHPDAYADMADLSMRAAQVLMEAMPPSMLASIQSPRGLPPSVDDVRTFSRVYMTVVEPQTFLRDLESGAAWPEQAQAFAQMYPQVWTRLAEEAITAARERGPALSPQDATYLDLTFGIGNTIGGMWSDATADAIRQANAAKAEQRQQRAGTLAPPKPAMTAPTSATAALSAGPSNTPV